jgi:3-oxoacyl-[acyl-carrier-protein] synthase-3
MDDKTHKIGKEIRVQGARIAGVVSCVPPTTINNVHFEKTFAPTEIANVVKMIGVETRRWVDAETTTSDLCTTASKHLLEKLQWSPDSIDAVLFISQTPDHVLPASACVIQKALGLPTKTIAFDVNLGCSGYVYALWLGMTMIQSGAAKRVILAVGDTISKIVNPEDRSTALLFGDAGTATALEACTSDSTAHFILGSDGAGAKDLIVPNSGFRNSAVTHSETTSNSYLYMNGGEIFNFTLRTIPALVAELMISADTSLEQQDYFLFHQANLFMLNHLVKKTKIPKEKAPINIQDYGNTSSASIPLLMTSSLATELTTKECQVSMFGFGVGFSWAAANLKVGPLACVETIEQ